METKKDLQELAEGKREIGFRQGKEEQWRERVWAGKGRAVERDRVWARRGRAVE